MLPLVPLGPVRVEDGLSPASAQLDVGPSSSMAGSPPRKGATLRVYAAPDVRVVEESSSCGCTLPEVVSSNPSLLAIASNLGKGTATPELFAAELNHLCKVERDWQVAALSDRKFSMIFPEETSFGMCTRSTDITLALNKLVVDILAPRIDHAVAAELNMAWILIKGLPDIARHERVIRNMSKLLGKVVVVDELSPSIKKRSGSR